MGTVTKMKPKTKNSDEPIYARCYVCLYTIDDIRQKLEKQKTDEVAKYSKLLSDATKKYREDLRNEENRTASKKVQAQLWIEAMDGVAERDRINKEKAATVDPIKAHLKQVAEAEAEVKAARRGDDSQANLFDDDAAGAVPDMPWATPGTCKILYSSLLALENLGVALGIHQAALLADLASAETGTIDLGLSASEAVEHDVDEDDFEDDESVAEDDGDKPLPF